MEILSTLSTLLILCGFATARPHADHAADSNRNASISTITSPACTPSSPKSSTGKRGLSYNHADVTNLFSSSSTTCPGQSSQSDSKVSWAYNWYSATHDPNVDPSSGPMNLQFVPMLWCARPEKISRWPTDVAAAKEAGWKELLSFNEPDRCGPGISSCMPVNDAVTAYLQHISPYHSDEFRLGAPGVTNSQRPNEGNEWLAKFLDGCHSAGCNIDFIPVHWYGGATDFDSFRKHLYDTYEKVGKGNYPIWVTEFGVQGGTDEEVEEFMRKAMSEMDRLDWVEKYSWFMAGAPGTLRGNLVANGQLSKFGELYDKF